MKRRGVDVRARKGYWARPPPTSSKISKPRSGSRQAGPDGAGVDCDVGAVRQVRAHVDRHRARRERQDARDADVGAAAAAARRAPRQPGRVSLLAADGSGDLVFRGRSPDAALASRPAAAPNDTGRAGRAPPRRHGAAAARVRLAARQARAAHDRRGGGRRRHARQEIRNITVPDFTAPRPSISTPRVLPRAHRARIPDVAADAAAVPAAGREFSRTERLLIRFDVYGPGRERQPSRPCC